jgi:hypothetical protein
MLPAIRISPTRAGRVRPFQGASTTVPMTTKRKNEMPTNPQTPQKNQEQRSPGKTDDQQRHGSPQQHDDKQQQNRQHK